MPKPWLGFFDTNLSHSTAKFLTVVHDEPHSFKEQQLKAQLKRMAVLAISCLSLATWAADITGAGATFPYPVYAKWAEAYKKETGVGLNYQSIGSSGGIRQIKAKTVTFGASDAPVKGDELDKDGMVQFPAIIGGTVPVVNLEGFKPGADGLRVQQLFGKA